MKTLSIIGYLMMVSALVGLVFTRSLFSSLIIVILIQVLAVVLMVWARKTFGLRSFHFSANPTEGNLVTTGPYRYIRHPVYAAVIFFCFPGMLANLSINSVFLFILLLAGCFIRIILEEKFLTTRYPEYKEYVKQTKRIIPFII
ncbi:MAG: isoprenylcysteine carboxylmethyltransferase family protein [Calditrichia bacterium]